MVILLSIYALILKSKMVDGPIYLDGARIPPCISDMADLPIHLVIAHATDATATRGTAFLINSNHWVTAAHVVDATLRYITIYADVKLSAKVIFIDDAADIAILETEAVDYTPIAIKNIPHNVMDVVWNVGYPGWAHRTQVVSTGSVITDGDTNGMISTDARVMTGMSGGPTLSCIGGNIEASSVISLFTQELVSIETINTINGVLVRRTYINSGESFSSVLDRINYEF